MERRVLLAIFLAFLVLYVWQALFVKPVPKPALRRRDAAGSAAAARSRAGAASGRARRGAACSAAADSAPPAAAPLVGDTAERDIRVETRDVIAVFTNRGARLKSWRLKHYLDQQRQPQELVETDLPTQPLPFSLRVADDAVDRDAERRALHRQRCAADAGAVTAPVDLRFEYRDSAGVHAVKEFHLDPSSYVVDVPRDGDATAIGALHAGDRVGPGGRRQSSEVSRYVAEGRRAAVRATARSVALAADRHREAAGARRRLQVRRRRRQLLHDRRARARRRARSPSSRCRFRRRPARRTPPRELMSYSIEPARRRRAAQVLRRSEGLRRAGGDRSAISTRAINFGMFAVIVVPLLRSLKWVNGYVGNYGWSIIILTIIINADHVPAAAQERRVDAEDAGDSARGEGDPGSLLQAEGDRSREAEDEPGDDGAVPERGVNPASGCVPMLLTLPVLLAFYALLSTAIELRGAPFFGWIHDLSAHDPYYVTPILMGVSQIWQQRMTPAAGIDPAQQKMMMFMPVIFTFMFLWRRPACALYWFVSNVWAIGQQYLTNYLIGPPQRPDASGRRRSAG